MHTELSHLTDDELVQRVYVSGEFLGWPTEQRELFYRMRDRHERLRQQATDRENHARFELYNS